MPPVMLALFAVCGLLGGFGAYQILSFANATRRTCAVVAILVALALFGGITARFAHAIGHPLFASAAQGKVR